MGTIQITPKGGVESHCSQLPGSVSFLPLVKFGFVRIHVWEDTIFRPAGLGCPHLGQTTNYFARSPQFFPV